MTGLATFARFGRERLAAVGRAWSWFWFQDSTTAPLELVRIGIGAVVLFHYSMATPFLFELWGDSGWMPRADALQYLSGPWMQSAFFYFTAPWQWIAFHVVFLLCCAAFMLGWRTSWVKWIVLVGQISYDYRNITLVYGADSIVACLLFILCLAPIGRAISLDRLRAVRAAKRTSLEAAPPPFASPWAGACIRLMQIQMAILFLYSGVDKTRWDEWWNGDAIWLVFSTYEFYNPVLLNLLARQYWLVNVATYATILIEIAFPFLIWQRRTRPYLLAAAIFLHLMFAILMGLVYFSLVMIMGHMSFMRPEWLHAPGAWWKRRSGDMEMIYDGQCGFCVRSMAWFLAFDGLRQITIRNFRTNPSPVVSDAQLEMALYTVLPDGRAMPGFEAYRHVVLRVPGLWWMVPFFHVPGLSRLFGHPIYNWVAANRGRLSTTMIWKWGRERLIYSAMSVFIAWHVMAVVVAPAPDDSPLVKSARVLFWPYLTLFRLENTWAFFEHVPRSPQFRYVIHDAAGKDHTFVPIEDFRWFYPRWNWSERSYWAIMEHPELYGDYFAAAFCRQHSELNPVSITLLMVMEQEFWPRDQLAGHRPLDPEFVTVNTLMSAKCRRRE